MADVAWMIFISTFKVLSHQYSLLYQLPALLVLVIRQPLLAGYLIFEAFMCLVVGCPEVGQGLNPKGICPDIPYLEAYSSWLVLRQPFQVTELAHKCED